MRCGHHDRELETPEVTVIAEKYGVENGACRDCFPELFWLRRTAVAFMDAQIGEVAHTYRPDPSGEHGWVTDTDWFEHIDDPVTVTRQRWKLLAEDKVTFHPQTELCPRCHGEGVVPVQVAGPDENGQYDADEIMCSTCDGDGRHPLAGQMEVLS